MILPDFKAFPRVGRIMGIDWGAARTGIAVSDPSRAFLFVRPVVNSKTDLAQRILKLASDEGVVGIVIGLPLRMDGTDSDTTARVREFAEQLAKLTDLPICFIDETLSSFVAQESMGRVRMRDIKEKLDSESARVMLENAIAVIRRLG